MGVKGTHSFLKRNGLLPDIKSSSDITGFSNIHVDILGAYYQFIINCFVTNPPEVAAKIVVARLGTYALMLIFSGVDSMLTTFI
jgi:hypothetical protein